MSFDLVNITTLVRKRYVFLSGGVLSSWGVYARCWRYVTVRAGFGLHGAGGGGAGQEDGTDASRATRTQLHDGQPAHEAGQAEQTTRDAPAHTHTHTHTRTHITSVPRRARRLNPIIYRRRRRSLIHPESSTCNRSPSISLLVLATRVTFHLISARNTPKTLY